jgi:hypothetical protein
MATALDIIIVVIQIVLLIVIAHLLLSKVLPKLRRILNSYVDDDSSKAITFLIFFVIIVLGVNILIEILMGLNNKIINYLVAVQPGMQLLTDFLPYLQWILVALIVLIGLKNKR